MARIIHNAGEIRRTIRKVFRNASERRVAVVAFVGADASSYLPDPKGLELFCWPRAGGTNPDAIVELLNNGVKITFVDRLHSKVYWSSSGGLLIGSANLTNNALGGRGLQEVAAHFPKHSFNIDGLLSQLSPIKDFDRALRDLRRQHTRYHMRVREGLESGLRPKSRSFAEWYAQGEFRDPFRLGWWDEDSDPPADTLDDETKAFSRYLAVKKKNHLRDDTFTLEFHVEQPTSSSSVHASEFRWWIPEICRRTEKAGWREYPYIWFAIHDPPRALRRPFNIRDARFTAALGATISEFGGIAWLYRGDLNPSSDFLRHLNRRYRERH